LTVESNVLKKVDVKARTLELEGLEPVVVGASVFVKLDGQPSDLSLLEAGDRVELHRDGEQNLVVVKVRRATPDGEEATTSAKKLAEKAAAAKPAAVAEDTDGDDPVKGLNVGEAKDKISRMTSVAKLEAIAANDHRDSVKQAATNRLEELRG
jgi:hypothetical protein